MSFKNEEKTVKRTSLRIRISVTEYYNIRLQHLEQENKSVKHLRVTGQLNGFTNKFRFPSVMLKIMVHCNVIEGAIIGRHNWNILEKQNAKFLVFYRRV